MTRKHVNLRTADGEAYAPEVGDTVELTDHQASRVVNKVRLQDSGPVAVSPVEARLTKVVANLTTTNEKLNARVVELEALVQAQAVELEKSAKAKAK